MSKVSLIIKREYLTRVRKKSFIIMTILGPLLMASIFMVPVLLSHVSEETKTIAVIDQSKLFENRLLDGENVKFVYTSESLELAKKKLQGDYYAAILVIPSNVQQHPQSVTMYSEKQPSLPVIDYIETTIQKRIEADKLLASGVNQSLLDSAKTTVRINTFKVTKAGDESSNSGLTTTIGFIGGVIIYFFIFLYGAQVMRGIIEEKTNRIVEVIISSVKPFQLMMGKIIGIALVALTQFLLWIILTFTITTFVTSAFVKDSKDKQMVSKAVSLNEQVKSSAERGAENAGSEEFFSILKSMNIPLILVVFVFYFIGGYLLYGALFAAIGSAVDSEADTQQFMLPVTIPLILSFLVAQFNVVSNPDGPVAFWFSVIPLTSPVVMMVRIPFGVPAWQLSLSMLCLAAGFIITTWLAGRVYRTGILMYGKKPSYKEIGKWLFYKG